MPINREEQRSVRMSSPSPFYLSLDDPVAISESCCPDSLLKMLLDLFSDKLTAGIFYTTDFMVLIDIITRQLSDLSPGDKVGI